MERAIQELEAFRRQFFALVEPGPAAGPDGRGAFSADAKKKLAEYARLYERTRGLRHALIIQREAMGPWKRDDVDRQYPLPEPETLPHATSPEGGR